MMISYFGAEWKKMNKAQAIIVSLIFLAISSFIGLGIYFANQSVLTEETESLVLWGQLTFYYSQILYTPMLAIIVSLCFMPEFERSTLKMLQANNISISKMLMGKILNVFLLLLPVQIVLFLVYLLGIFFTDIKIDGSVLIHLKWIAISCLASLPLICLQSFISVKTKSFSRSVAIAAIASMGGFVLLFFNQSLSIIYPYSFLMIALRSRTLDDFTFSQLIFFFGICLANSILFYLLSKRALKNAK